ncbi:MarR family winged helix-turn-helix transcriptional regulator [Bacillus massiliigorillae]|uniref:MarR family winged helix-turn-helix transcriptional regulator n=1 Tax=Bacillus massiliigorillae TaxID=1243664 RepID=UPI00039D9ECC|nr:MarR family transcriptional regulator [Bacillus massiliigorillae]
MNHQSEKSLALLLALSLHSSIDELHKSLSEKGFDDIRPIHGYLFSSLIPNGATGIELANHLGITKQAVSKMIDYLEKCGYVMREPHPTDKRGKMIILAERGWLVVNEKNLILSDIEGRLIEKIGKDRMRLLKEDLSTIVTDKDEKSMPKARPIW